MLDAPGVVSYTILDSLPTSRLFKLENNVLAGKNNKSSKKASGTTTITRITAKDSNAKAAQTSQPDEIARSVEPASKQETETSRKNPLKAIGGYFSGAWYELKQVRWPTRRATWSMTAAMLIFTAFFVVIILLLDAAFKYLFEVMLG